MANYFEMTQWYKFNNKFHNIAKYLKLCDPDLHNMVDCINLYM